ncbi:MAG: PASTA domain-containing protein, partial [Sedimentisphaerales bacterium]
EQAWTGQGFTLGTATPVVSCPAGVILSQSTGCHAQGYAVNYSYSVAPTSPNIVNKTMSDANATLAALGITVGTITYEPNGLKTALTVDRQSPPAGTATCGPVNYVVDTNCLYATRVFSLYGTVTFTVTTAQVTLWNTLGRPNCWCCVAQKRGNGVYAPSSTASKTDALDFAAVKNAANWSKNDTAAANVCLDFNLSGKIDALDLAIVKNANNWSKVTGPGPLCQ